MRKLTVFLLILSLNLSPVPIYTYAQDAPLNITDFALPEALGKIDSRFVGSSDRWVLLIQDIHGHFTAQENISAIIDHLNQLYGIDTFGIEGGWSKTKMPRTNALANSRAKQQLARALMEDEYMTGPFYSAFFSVKPLKLVGIENQQLYVENRKYFLEQINAREETQQKIKTAEDALVTKKSVIYHPELLSFDRELTNFREGRKAETFMPSLVSMADNLGIETIELDQIQLFKEILAAEKNLDRKKLSAEAKRLTQNSPNPRLSFEEILRGGQIPQEQLNRYPEIIKFKQIMALQDTISHHAFFDQIENTIGRVKEKLLQSEEEKQLDAQSERFGLIKKIALLRAVPDDIKKAAHEKDTLREQAAQVGLSESLETGVRFYRLAQKRDSAFFQQIVKNPLLAGTVTIVAGGFHAEGLTARLEKAGISYMIITPSLGEEPEAPNEELYFQRMRDGAALAEEQTLSPLSNIPFTRRFDMGIAKVGVPAMESTRDQRVAVEATLNYRELPSASKSNTKGFSINAEGFMAMSGEQQRAAVEEWVNISEKPGKEKVVLGYRTPALAEILNTPEGFTAFKKFVAPDKQMVLGELRAPEDEYLILETKQPIRIPISEATDLANALIEKFQRGNEKPPIAIIDPAYQNDSVTVLPPSAASLMFARLFLENKPTGNVTQEFLDRVSSLMRDIFEAQGVLEASA